MQKKIQNGYFYQKIKEAEASFFKYVMKLICKCNVTIDFYSKNIKYIISINTIKGDLKYEKTIQCR